MKITILLATLLLVLPLHAQQEEDAISADRPGIADSSGTVGRGIFQIELGAERDDDSGARAWSTPLLLRYGATDRLELRFETAGWERVSIGGRSTDDFAPTSIGVKYHFHDAPSAGVIARVFTNAAADLRLSADLDLGGDWSMNPNVGVSVEHDGGRVVAGLAALTLGRNVTPNVNVFVDGATTAPVSGGGSTSVLLDTGIAWVIGRDTQLDASIGWGARGDAPNIFWSAGISRRF